MTHIKPTVLSGQFVKLEPLTNSHREDLRIIAEDEEIWRYTPYPAIGKNFARYFDSALQGIESGKQLGFAIRQISTQKIIGSTRYYDINLEHSRLAIGYTWYIQSARGTAINPECKLLLLSHAFEKLNTNRIELFTDSRNLHSRAAIKKLGATEEGIMRQHMVLDNGYVRDSVLFSIIKPEWSAIKEKLHLRLKEFS